MLYDASRTKDIVNRLVLLGNNLRIVLIVINTVQYAALLGILGTLVGGPLWLIFALVGAIVGAGIGYFLANALAVVLEWMAQLLISRQPNQ
jgi:phosphate/sulfate permease